VGPGGVVGAKNKNEHCACAVKSTVIPRKLYVWSCKNEHCACAIDKNHTEKIVSSGGMVSGKNMNEHCACALRNSQQSYRENCMCGPAEWLVAAVHWDPVVHIWSEQNKLVEND
jgi:hypothetical protein